MSDRFNPFRSVSSIISNRVDLSETYYDVGKTMVHKKNYLEALKVFDQALEYEPTNIKYLNAALLAAYLAKKINSANHYADTLLADHPDHVNAIIIKGLYSLSRNDERRAKFYFERALKIEPENRIAIANLQSLTHGKNQVLQETSAYKVMRKHLRRDVNLGLFVNFLDQTGYQMENMVSLSPGGGFVVSKAKVNPGDRLMFMLPIGTHRRINGAGRVLYCGTRPSKRGMRKGYGVAFDDLKNAESTYIETYLKKG